MALNNTSILDKDNGDSGGKVPTSVIMNQVKNLIERKVDSSDF